jgi:ADP-ribose pyrophosphatase YjhB (NUDIX family)
MAGPLETNGPAGAGGTDERKPTVRVSGIAMTDGRVLLVRQQRDESHYWLLPGGGVRFAESFEVALAREFAEETGLIARPQRVVALAESISPDPTDYAKHVVHVVMDVIIDPDQADARTVSDAAILDCAWMSPAETQEIDLRPPIAAFIAAHVRRPLENVVYLGVLW